MSKPALSVMLHETYELGNSLFPSRGMVTAKLVAGEGLLDPLSIFEIEHLNHHVKSSGHLNIREKSLWEKLSTFRLRGQELVSRHGVTDNGRYLLKKEGTWITRLPNGHVLEKCYEDGGMNSYAEGFVDAQGYFAGAWWFDHRLSSRTERDENGSFVSCWVYKNGTQTVFNQTGDVLRTRIIQPH